jgi:spore maturation protein CgeB
MKFFLAGSADPSSSESSYARLLREKGCDVFLFKDKAPFPLFGKRDWWQLTRGEKVTYDAIASVRFYKACRDYKPDVLFMPKAENIHSYAVRRALEDTRARLVVWYPDNPFKADQTSMNILRDLRRCDVFYIWGKFLIDALRSAGCRRVEYLPFGFDPVQHPPDTAPTPEEQTANKSDICFVGTWDPEREAALLSLAEFDLGIWGPFWKEEVDQRSPLYSKIRGDGVYGVKMVKVFKSARIVFNHLRLHNGPAHNARTMEVTGIGGGALLVRRTPEQAEELFREGAEIFCFDPAADLKSCALELLMKPEELRSAATKAQQVVFGKHLLAQRIERVLSDLR